MNTETRNIKDIKYGFVHGGNFHADDVFATALLKLLNPTILIQRGFQIPEGFDGIAYDIGYGGFDHHQKDKRVRDNGIPYAAFGLLWEAYGCELLNPEDVKDMDEKFVQMIDLADNGGEPNPISEIISMMNPNWDENLYAEAAFYSAVEFATSILVRYIERYNSKRRAYELVKDNLDGSKVLRLPTYMPWKDAVEGEDILFVVYPSNRGGYNVQAVPKNKNTVDLKLEFPRAWRGLTPNELKDITGIETFTFCHPSGFLCGVGNIEDADKLIHFTVAYYDERG